MGSPPQYGAVVFDDDVGARIADAVRRGLNITTQAGGALPGGSPLDAFALIIRLLGASPEGRCDVERTPPVLGCPAALSHIYMRQQCSILPSICMCIYV